MALKVYYLDDEPDLLEIFVDTFSSEDVTIRPFTDPGEALTAIVSDPPDLLFLDFRLPKTTGVIIASQVDPKIPKVLITGDLAVGTQGMFVSVLEKPMNPNAVMVILETHKKKT